MNIKLPKVSILLVIASVANLCTIYSTNLAKSANLNTKNKSSHSDVTKLHRLDFRIEGKSCAACLLSIQRKLNSLPGVKEAVVMLKPPFGVSVIFQENLINKDEILAVVKNKEPNIKVTEVTVGVLVKPPSPLIPPFVPSIVQQ